MNIAAPPLGRIPAGRLTGVRRAPSVLAIGTSALGSYEAAAPVYDAFFEAGGNLFDTAWVYGQGFAPGCCERTLGRWLATRGVRSQVVLLAKGGHPPYCNPELLAPQLVESCERLGVERVDLYMPHRDDLTRPAADFVEACAGIVADGLADAYGFSNWTLPRVDEALDHAGSGGRPQPVAISNQLSLLRMERPVYPGCVTARNRGATTWFRREGLALIAWSSQARGLHTVPDGTELLAGPDTCWSSRGNIARLRRTAELARRRGVRPVNVALAWVLHRPFDVFPVIGPRSAAEVHEALAGLSVQLSPGEIAWLDRGGRLG